MKEKSYVMIKPEFANSLGVLVEISKRLQETGLKVVKGSYIRYTKEAAEKHYAEHVGKDFYPDLEKYITSDKAYGMIVEGEDAIKIIRSLVGSTKDPKPGTIRYDIPEMLGLERRVTENVVHASDSPEAAEREIKIFRELFATKTVKKDKEIEK